MNRLAGKNVKIRAPQKMHSLSISSEQLADEKINIASIGRCTQIYSDYQSYW